MSWLDPAPAIRAVVILALVPLHHISTAEASPPRLDRAKATTSQRLSLGEALQRTALRHHQSITYSAELVRGRVAPAVPEDASLWRTLDALLRHMPLRYRRLSDRTILIERAPRTPSGSAHREEQAVIAPGEIIVTALRKPTALADTPASILVATGSDLEQQRATSLEGLATLAPSLYTTAAPFGTSRLALRGAYSAGEPTVGLYYNSAPVSGPSGSTADPSLMTPDLLLIDVDRVEILRGPQGTLQGSGSLSGTVRVHFSTPDPEKMVAEWHEEIWGQKGGDPGNLTWGVVNLPVREGTLGLRLVAYRQARGGVTDNIRLGRSNVDGSLNEGVRAALRWQANQDWRVDLTGAVQRSQLDDAWGGQYDQRLDISRRAAQAPSSNRLMLVSGEVHGDARPFTVEANLSFTRWRVRRLLDFSRYVDDVRRDGIRCVNYLALAPGTTCTGDQIAQWTTFVDSLGPTVLVQPLSIDTTSGEVNLSNDGVALDWTAGLFVSARKDHGRSDLRQANSASGMMLVDDLPVSSRSFYFSLRQFAVFAEATWHLAPAVDLTGGARYFAYSRVAGGAVTTANPFNIVREALRSVAYRYGASGVVGRVRIDYRPSDRSLFYGQIASGFRPGGINVVPELDPGLVIFRDDRLKSYEVGMRLASRDRRIAVDASAFRQFWSNMQYAATAAGGNFLFVTNLGSAVMKGWELGVTFNAARWLSARLDAAYVDARLHSDQANAQSSTPGRRGDRLPFVVPFALGGTIRAYWPISSAARADISLSGRFASRFFSTFSRDDPGARALGVAARMDLRGGVDFGSWNVSLFVQNLFDTRSVRFASRTSVSDDMLLEPPRAVGVSVSGRF